MVNQPVAQVPYLKPPENLPLLLGIARHGMLQGTFIAGATIPPVDLQTPPRQLTEEILIEIRGSRLSPRNCAVKQDWRITKSSTLLQTRPVYKRHRALP